MMSFCYYSAPKMTCLLMILLLVKHIEDIHNAHKIYMFPYDTKPKFTSQASNNPL